MILKAKELIYLIFHGNSADQLESSTISGAGSNNKARDISYSTRHPPRPVTQPRFWHSDAVPGHQLAQGLRLMSLIFKTQSARGCVNVTGGSVSEANAVIRPMSGERGGGERERSACGIEARGLSCAPSSSNSKNVGIPERGPNGLAWYSHSRDPYDGPPTILDRDPSHRGEKRPPAPTPKNPSLGSADICLINESGDSPRDSVATFHPDIAHLIFFFLKDKKRRSSFEG